MRWPCSGHDIRRVTQSSAKEAFGRSFVAFGREEEVNRLPGGIHRSIEIPSFPLHLDIRLVDPVGTIRRFEKRSTAGGQLWAVALDPAEDAALIDRPALLLHQARELAIAQGELEIPADTE